jgi:hypothetical protein
VLSHKDTLVLEYASAAVNASSTPATATASASITRSRLAQEIEKEAALWHVMLQDIASAGELRLQGTACDYQLARSAFDYAQCLLLCTYL